MSEVKRRLPEPLEAPSFALPAGRIRFDSVGKRYRRRHVDALLLRQVFSLGHRKTRSDEFWALRDVTFDVDRGETVAVMGQNGSGKSTLLSLVAATTPPSTGCVSVRGRVAPVLALGVGFEPDLTSIENAYLNANLLGASEEEVDEVIEDILAFAGLGDFVDTPVRHYSSGMLARLGFAVAMHIEREILLVDEVLTVGDQEFQWKCVDRVRTLQERGLTMLFATHDLPMAVRVCDRGIWIRDGSVALDGPVDECVAEYAAFLGEPQGAPGPAGSP